MSASCCSPSPPPKRRPRARAGNLALARPPLRRPWCPAAATAGPCRPRDRERRCCCQLPDVPGLGPVVCGGVPGLLRLRPPLSGRGLRLLPPVAALEEELLPVLLAAGRPPGRSHRRAGEKGTRPRARRFRGGHLPSAVLRRPGQDEPPAAPSTPAAGEPATASSQASGSLDAAGTVRPG